VYSVVDGKLGRRELIPTREIAALENDWQSAAADTDVTPVIQLQTDVTSLAMRTWTQGETGWRIDGTDIQNAATDGAAKNPAIKSAKLAGLEVSMQVQGREAPMTKCFCWGQADADCLSSFPATWRRCCDCAVADDAGDHDCCQSVLAAAGAGAFDRKSAHAVAKKWILRGAIDWARLILREDKKQSNVDHLGNHGRSD
jgi:hypothetical protein